MPPDPDAQPSWAPRANVFVNQVGEFVIEVELSTLRKEDIELTVDGHSLQISGVRLDNNHDGEREYRLKEIGSGPFKRVVDVPLTYDLGSAKAAYSDGVLRVAIPRKKV